MCYRTILHQVEREIRQEDGFTRVTYHTPEGSVSGRFGYTEEMKRSGVSISWIDEHVLKTPKDYAVLEHIFSNAEVLPAYDNYRKWREWVGEEPFLVLLGDHVFLSEKEESCTAQLVRAFEQVGHTVTALSPTPESLLPLLGTMSCEPTDVADIYSVRMIVEKPDVRVARRHLRTPGLPEGTYLSHFGMHAFTPSIFECLQEMVDRDVRERGEIQLTAAQEMLRLREPYYATVVHGRRYDMGVPLGYLETQLALAIRGPLAADVHALCGRFVR